MISSDGGRDEEGRGEARGDDGAAHTDLAGRLLVATPALVDPNFDRAVVLVLDHDEQGALGVTLNEPSDVRVGDILPAWQGFAGADAGANDVVHAGGPVGTDSALALAVVAASAGPEEIVGFRPLGDRLERLGLLDLDVPPALVADALSAVRVFAGYAGWGPGQLESEVAAEAWFVVASTTVDVFTTDPGNLWRDVLRRQPGPLAWLSTAPADPTMN